MAPRDCRLALYDIVAALDGIADAASGKTFDDFTGDWLLKHGIQRGIEIISEASRALPADLTALRPEIPWPRVRAIGVVLRHEYHGLSDQVIWRLVEDELPRLRTAIEAIRAEMPRES